MEKLNCIKRRGTFFVFMFAFFLSFGVLGTSRANASTDIIARGNQVTQDSSVPESYHKYAISFRTSDGVKLVGYVLGSGTNGVTLGHASGWTLKSLVPFANELVEKGYKVIMWDYRNNPPSDIVSKGTATDRLDLDALAAVDVLRSEGVNKIFMLGASMGGTSSIIAATQNPDLVGLGILSSPRGTGSAIFAGDAIKQVTVPSFFAVSKNDFSGDYFTEVKALYDNSGAKDKVFNTIDSGEHGFDMLLAPNKYLDGIEPETPYKFTKNPEPLRLLNQKLLDFIDKSFGKMSTANSNKSSSSSSNSSSSLNQSQPSTKVEQETSKNTSPLVFTLVALVAVFLIGGIIIGIFRIRKH